MIPLGLIQNSQSWYERVIAQIVMILDEHFWILMWTLSIKHA